MESRLKLLVIADDLTGGLDTGVQFALRGITSRTTQQPAFGKVLTPIPMGTIKN